MNRKSARKRMPRAGVKLPAHLRPNRCLPCPYLGPWGECLDATIKSGRCGDWVWYLRGNRQCRRRWAKPNDPRTPAQLRSRARLAAASTEYSTALTEQQRQVCIAAGARQQSRLRLRQSGKLTGQLHWVKQRCAAKTPVPPAKAGG
jgi:hypothetical protein